MPRNTGIGQRRNELSISLNPFWAISQKFIARLTWSSGWRKFTNAMFTPTLPC